MGLSHRERIERTISGQKVDRPAVSLWRHFPVDDQNPEELARSILNFQDRFDFDFIKITPASSFCLKDWGLLDEWHGNPEGTRQITNHPIVKKEDWEKLKPISPVHGSLGRQLSNLQLVRKGTPDTTPILQTIFSPLSQVKNLVGKENLVPHIRIYPDEVKKALQVITDTTIDFINECISVGVDGIFYAIQQAQYSLLNEFEFREFGEFYDRQVLEAARPLWFKLGHVHGSNIMFDIIKDYPINMINWHDQETFPNLKSGKALFPNGAVCGGLKQWETLAYGNPSQVKEEAFRAIDQTNGERFVLGTGCVTPIIAPDSNIFAVRQSVEELK
jgi:uroporphyrinogen decarboxylase